MALDMFDQGSFVLLHRVAPHGMSLALPRAPSEEETQAAATHVATQAGTQGLSGPGAADPLLGTRPIAWRAPGPALLEAILPACLAPPPGPWKSDPAGATSEL